MPIRKKPIRVLVRWEGGQWTAVLGDIGEIKVGALAELYIDRNEFVDQARASSWAAKRTVMVLPPGTELRVALSIRTDLDGGLEAFMLDSNATRVGNVTDVRAGARFVPIRILGSTEAQHAKLGHIGGLWLCLEGMEAKRIESGRIGLPLPTHDNVVDTLNQAFTRLSELFEPWRTSHTGNIYVHIFYLESDGQWYPLDDLRNSRQGGTERGLRTWVWNTVGAQLELPLPEMKKRVGKGPQNRA